MSSFIPTVNLPLPVLVHALGLFFGGIKYTFTPPSPTAQHDNTVVGITTTAIGLCYLSTAYVPIEQNIFLYASAPVRVGLGVLAGTRLAIDYFYLRGKEVQQRRTSDLRKTLWFIALYDGLGGLFVGWWLGTLSGKIPAYQM
jgi:hypothetical protein